MRKGALRIGGDSSDTHRAFPNPDLCVLSLPASLCPQIGLTARWLQELEGLRSGSLTLNYERHSLSYPVSPVVAKLGALQQERV